MNEAGSQEPRRHHCITGDALLFMWDYGVVVPLWIDHRLVPEDPPWLRDALGLSDPLIRDLVAWGDAMSELHGDSSQEVDQATYGELKQRAAVLVDRLQQEVGSRFTVTCTPRLVAE